MATTRTPAAGAVKFTRLNEYRVKMVRGYAVGDIKECARVMHLLVTLLLQREPDKINEERRRMAGSSSGTPASVPSGKSCGGETPTPAGSKKAVPPIPDPGGAAAVMPGEVLAQEQQQTRQLGQERQQMQQFDPDQGQRQAQLLNWVQRPQSQLLEEQQRHSQRQPQSRLPKLQTQLPEEEQRQMQPLEREQRQAQLPGWAQRETQLFKEKQRQPQMLELKQQHTQLLEREQRQAQLPNRVQQLLEEQQWQSLRVLVINNLLTNAY